MNFMLDMEQQMKDLVNRLNYYTKKYDEGNPEISDKEWDDLYFQLQKLENDLGYYCSDSPTRAVNYQVINKLNKVSHNHKMLSLDKTKNLDDIKAFCGNQMMAVMPKVDGLTCSLTYKDGKLVSAETRGDGFIGEDVLHNALTIPTIPHRISYKQELVVDGEIVCLAKDFQDFAEEYKNSRNFAAGSIRLLDAKECSKRKLTFIAWDVIKGFDNYNNFFDRMLLLSHRGFKIVPIQLHDSSTITDKVIDDIKYLSKINSIPIDGLVFKFNDVAYGQSQGETAHHLKNAIAYKFYDEEYETELLDIEWSMGRTGILTPVAIFKPVDDGESIIERASLHNVNILHETLGNFPHKYQPIKIAKSNMIIPQVVWADKNHNCYEEYYLHTPAKCPICGENTAINDSQQLYCINPNCEGKFINRLNHFCGKKGLDIKGLSSATLEKLVSWGWIENLIDLYHLDQYKNEWEQKSGFGEKSVKNILQSIEDSRECSLESFISALGIPLVGKSVASELTKYFSRYEEFRKAVDDNYDFSQHNGFASSKTSALLNFDYTEADQLVALEVHIQEIKREEKDLPLDGKKYVITGTVNQFKNRNQLKAYIEKRGGKVVSAISKNVDYLINNNAASTSAKNVAAKKIGIPIVTEAEFLETLN